MREASAKRAVIVEIGNDWLKIAQTEPSREGVVFSKVHLRKFESFGTPLVRALSDAFNRQNFDRIPVIVCIPRQLVNIRMLEFPSTDSDEIAGMADIQVGKQTPYSKDEIVFDYRIMKGGRPGYTRVMMAIAQNSVVRERCHALEEAGVDVERMSVSTEGVLNWCMSSIASGGDGAAIGVLDVDSFYSDFVVVANGGLAFTRSILTGTNQMFDGTRDGVQKFVVEVKRCLDACQSEVTGLSVRKVLVTGAGANIKDLNTQLSGVLSIPAENVDALKYIRKLPREFAPADPNYRGISMTAIVGMGLAPGGLELNLIPDSLRLRKELELKAKALSVFGMLVMALIVFFSMYAVVKLCLKSERLAALQEALKNTEARVQDVAGKQALVQFVTEYHDPKFSTVNLLSEIQARTPEGIFFDALEFDIEKEKDQIHLSGSGVARNDVSALVKSLEQSALIRDVREEGATVKNNETGRYTFKILCGLERKK